MTDPRNLSDAERHLIEAAGFGYLIDAVERGSLMAPMLWNVIAMRVFVDDVRDSRADAVRRVVRALESTSVYRMTPEFDALCAFEGEHHE